MTALNVASVHQRLPRMGRAHSAAGGRAAGAGHGLHPTQRGA
ncbi:hypothetical protein [Streptomyces sp. B1I3]|nr:hypothetical protein [Streptomyces sp. B1I3]